MKTEEIINGNKLIAEFMGGVYETKEQPIPYFENIEFAGPYPSNEDLKYHTSWDWLMPVVRKIVELCCDSDNYDLFMSDHYTSILDTIPIAIIEDAYKVVVEFIEWYNAQQ